MTTQTPAEALATLHRMVGHVTITNPDVLVASDGPGETAATGRIDAAEVWENQLERQWEAKAEWEGGRL